MNKTIATYMGRPIAELSRDELIEALEEAGGALLREREEHMRTMGILGAINRKRV
jgi:hypothetical protein